MERRQDGVGQSSEPDLWAQGLTPQLRLGDPGWLPQLAAGEIAGKTRRVSPCGQEQRAQYPASSQVSWGVMTVRMMITACKELIRMRLF